MRRVLLDIDARIDFGIFRGAGASRELYERFSDFMDRFHVSGWRRWLVVEPLSEAATLGLGGLIVALALALPAFQETRTRTGCARPKSQSCFSTATATKSAAAASSRTTPSRSTSCQIT